MKGQPFSETHYRDQDDYWSGGLREKLFRDYRVNEIRETLGLNWHDWLQKALCEIEWELTLNNQVSKDIARAAKAGNKNPPDGDGDKSSPNNQPKMRGPDTSGSYSGHKRV